MTKGGYGVDKKAISLMNVSRQYENLSSQINRAVENVLQSGKYIMGDYAESNVLSFEKEFSEYIGAGHGIAVGNGTDALVIALKSLGIGSGDEVITTAMSFFATAEAIATVGAVPIFVDCQKDTFLIDHEQIEKKITAKTKAIIPVHLYGQCANMDRIMDIAGQHKLFVIEDAAQATGALYKDKRAGAIGDIGCFSFFPTKNLGCAGDGGMIVTNNEDIAKKARAFRVHGSGKEGQYLYESMADKSTAAVDFGDNQPKYFNFAVGHNSRLDEIQAAILRVKLPHLDQWNNRRREIATAYYESIVNPSIKLPAISKDVEHSFYVFVIKTEQRDKLKKYLFEKGIASGVYFPIPLHRQIAFENLEYKAGDMPNAENAAGHTLAIPMFPELSEEEQSYIVRALNHFR